MIIRVTRHHAKEVFNKILNRTTLHEGKAEILILMFSKPW